LEERGFGVEFLVGWRFDAVARRPDMLPLAVIKVRWQVWHGLASRIKGRNGLIAFRGTAMMWVWALSG